MKLVKLAAVSFAIGAVFLSFSLCSSHYIVFEDVGQVATSLIYLHVSLPLNFSDIDQLILHYYNAILEAKKKVNHINKKDLNANHYKHLYWDDNFLHYTKRLWMIC